ncbi:MAG: amidohydrolase family protein, partial [Acidaminococcaceae bacterium]|nr:amidohydrolase family protein [Acidaminococcaceae bacterium]
MHAIRNGRIVLNDKILDGCALLFDRKIIGIVSRETLDSAWEKGKCWQGKPLTLTDARGAYVSPGFINLHIHGCTGADTMDATEDTLAVMSRFLVQTGVTAFLPTTMTCAKADVYKALQRIRETMTVITRRRDETHEPAQTQRKPANEAVNTSDTPSSEHFPAATGISAKTEEEKHCLLPGAKVLGAYLEGPFISSQYKGAQKEEFITQADFAFIKDFDDVIKVVVLAPETLRDALTLREFVAQCRTHHMIVSLGHSAAEYDTALQAIREGASHVTHLCNAMTGLHHRNPGLLG